MSNNIDDKKVKVKKRKKEEMSIEDFCKKNNIKLKIDISYEESPEKEIPNKKIKNKNNFQKSLKLDDDYINNNFDNSIKFYKMNSNSSNNISTDDDTKSKEYNKDNKDLIFEKNYINENHSTINNIRKNNNVKYNNISKINSNVNKINYRNLNNVNINYIPNNNITNINYNNNINIINNNIKNQFIGFQNYYNTINTIRSNCFNYIKNKNKEIFAYNNLYYNNCLKTIDQCIKNIQKKIDDINSEINKLKNQTLNDIIFAEQRKKIFYYLKKKTNIVEIENNNIKFNNTSEKKQDDSEEKENLKHPYFYMNQKEKKEVKKILYLIEGLFHEDNLIKDYTLIEILNRDGYASLQDLEKHPQLVYLKINEEHLKTVFSEHRINDVTETVESFDGILIRNKEWNKLKKKYDLSPKKIKQNLLFEMGNMKNNNLMRLKEEKNQSAQIQDKLQFKYHLYIQKIKQFQNCFNYIDNMYTTTNLKINNNIFNNNTNYNYNFNYNNNKRGFYN